MSVGVTRVGGWFDYFRAAGLAGYLARHAGAVTHFSGAKQRALTTSQDFGKFQ
jgi:hypothetical protein